VASQRVVNIDRRDRQPPLDASQGSSLLLVLAHQQAINHKSGGN